MSKFTVTTPTDFSGASAGVMFANGTAELDTDVAAHARALAYFARKGYGVTALDEPDKSKTEAPDEGGVAQPEQAEASDETKTTRKTKGATA